jgi:putative peptidoglycan lipid II flippase
MAGSIRTRSVLSLIAINGATQLAGFGLQMVIARQFGASVNLDAYLAGLAIPQYLILIINTGINASLLPAYYERPEEQREGFLHSLFYSVVLCCVPITLLGFIAAPWLFRFFFSELPAPTVAIGIVICRYGFISVFTIVVTNFLGSVHFIRGKFEYQAMVPAIAQVANLLLVFLLSKLGIYALLISLLSAQVLQIALLLPVLRWRDLPEARPKLFTTDVTRFFWVIQPMILSTVFIKLTGVWDRYLAGVAAGEGVGAISHVDYALKITTAVAALSISALPTLIYPAISAAAAKRNHPEFLKWVNDGLFFSFFVTVPITCIGYFICNQVVRLFLERGHFLPTDTAEVATVLRLFLISVIARGLGGVTGNALYALRLTGWVATGGALESLLYVGYSYFLTRKLGVLAIPIAATISFVVSFLWAVPLIQWKTRNRTSHILSDYLEYIKVVGAALVTAVAAFWISRRFSGDAITIVITAGSGLILYLALCWFAGVNLARRIVDGIAAVAFKWKAGVAR